MNAPTTARPRSSSARRGTEHAWLNPDNTEGSKDLLSAPAIKSIRKSGARSAEMVSPSLARHAGIEGDLTYSDQQRAGGGGAVLGI